MEPVKKGPAGVWERAPHSELETLRNQSLGKYGCSKEARLQKHSSKAESLHTPSATGKTKSACFRVFSRARASERSHIRIFNKSSGHDKWCFSDHKRLFYTYFELRLGKEEFPHFLRQSRPTAAMFCCCCIQACASLYWSRLNNLFDRFHERKIQNKVKPQLDPDLLCSGSYTTS